MEQISKALNELKKQIRNEILNQKIELTVLPCEDEHTYIFYVNINDTILKFSINKTSIQYFNPILIDTFEKEDIESLYQYVSNQFKQYEINIIEIGTDGVLKKNSGI